MRFVSVVSVVPLLLFAGCGGGGEATAPAETVTVTTTPTFLGDPTTAVTETPTDDADPFAPNTGDRALRVGKPRVGSQVTTVLLETDLGVSAEYRTPEAGRQFLGLRISTCVRKDADISEGPIYSTYPGEWYAVTGAGDEYTTSSSYNDFPSPKYSENVTIPPGQCQKGWIALEVPDTQRKFDKIVYRPGGETVAEWTLS